MTYLLDQTPVARLSDKDRYQLYAEACSQMQQLVQGKFGDCYNTDVWALQDFIAKLEAMQQYYWELAKYDDAVLCNPFRAAGAPAA